MNKQSTLTARDVILPFAVLLLFWNMLTPETTPASLVIGVVVSAGTVVFCWQILFRGSDFPLYTLRTIPVYVGLLLRLVVEVFKSNIDVAITVLSPRLEIQPQFVRLPVEYRSRFNRVVQAQCITLTPGTISVEVEDDSILVHALTDRAAEALQYNFARAPLTRTEEIWTR